MKGDVDADSAVIDTIRARYEELGEAAPHFGLFLCDCVDVDGISGVIERIPDALDDLIDEVVVMLDRPSGSADYATRGLLRGRRFDLRFHRPPRDSGYGAIRKAAFEYALLKGFDHVILMRGDGSHAPEALPNLIASTLADPDRFALVAGRDRGEPSRLRSSWRGLSHRLATFVQNRIVGMRLNDFDTGFRIYPADALRRIPYQLNSDNIRFELETILQLRALGIPIHEEPSAGPPPIEADTRSEPGNEDLAHEFMACVTAIGYRLHQMHLTRDGRYLVDLDIHYTLKHSTTGSHSQIVSAIAPDSTVLDLGCSNGLLARPLLEKNVSVTGVDAGPGESLTKELAEYYQRDLELPLELPFGRVFGYVVCADVIEHLRNRGQLLRYARRYLKPDGTLIISTPNIALWFYRLSLLAGRFEYGTRGVLDETHVHLYTGATFRREVENAGFSVIRKRVTALPFEVVFESTGRSRLVRSLAIAYHWMARAWPSMFAYQYILEARITTLDEESVFEPPATADISDPSPVADDVSGIE